MDISEQQQQQQTRHPYLQEPPPPSSYDPSQSQSYEAYYAYHHHHQQQQYYDPSSYPYCDYSSTQNHPIPTQIHHLPEHHPAEAEAAMSALSQIVGGMNAAERLGMTYSPHPPYPHHYPIEHGHVSIQPGGSGGGRRGGGPFRGGGRRGRGRGGGGRRPTPPAPVLPVAWCDICRVECNSLEILEQHKNGKQHKKKSQRVEEIQKQQKLLAEYQQVKSIPNTITENAVEVVEAKEVPAEPEVIPTASVFSTQVGESIKASGTDDSSAQVDDGSKPYNAETEQNSECKGADMEGSTGRKRGGGRKRKVMKYGRGGKRLKRFEPVPRRAPERPRVCTLCNVKCESLVVFESHVAGKKHISKMKRCRDQGAVFGPITVYVPPNQPSAFATRGQEPLFYGLTSDEMIQQAENYGLHQGGVSEQQAMLGLEANGGTEVAGVDNTDPQDPANAPLVFESREPNLSTAVTEPSIQ